MKKLILNSLILMASTGHADVIKCVFTEPFVDTTYSMTQSTLTYQESENKIRVIKNVSFQIKSAGVFELIAKDGQVLQTLTLNNRGSDGIKDDIYPYEVQDSSMLSNANLGIGGCTSNQLKKISDN